MPGQRGGDVQLQREPGGGRVELRADDADHSGLLQPAHPVQRCRGRQADEAGQFDVRAVRVGLQRSEQLYVNFIKFNGHSTKGYLATTRYGQILYRCSITMAV